MQTKISFHDSPSTADEERTLRACSLFREHGTLLIENAFPKELIEKLAAAFAEQYETISKRELRKRDAVVGDRHCMSFIVELYRDRQFLLTFA